MGYDGKGSEGGHLDRRFRIFLSSTSKDLRDYRTRVAGAIERLDQTAVRMESFGAGPDAPIDVCREKAAGADAVVVIVAHRYGWVPSAEEGGDGKKSITWHEVDAAHGAGKPVFAFLVDPEYPWTGPREQDRLKEVTSQKAAGKVFVTVQALEDFKAELESRVTRETFTTPDDLVAKVTTSLFPWLLDEALHRPSDDRAASSPPTPTPTPKATVDFTPYLEDLVDRVDHINISGIATQHVHGALRYPIEKLYTPLSSRAPLAGESLDALAALRHERVALADLLPRYERLLIEGQPGAGKTTFLRFAACMLARDALGTPCPEGGTWRQRHLGLAAGGAPRIPVFVRVADLVSRLTDEKAPRLRRNNRQWLLDLLAQTCEENGLAVSAEQWQKVLADGDAILLLDGLDEAADEKLRRRIFAIFRDACKRWKCPVVVTSRPIDTAPLRELEFHTATIEPFGDAEIRTFVDHWVAALHTGKAPAHGGEVERYGATLSEAIVGHSRVRRLAGNPVMLTCLCVVHWNEGRLPEGRSRVYRSVIRWLIAARSEVRRSQGFTDLFARRALARLALAMMSAEGGKRSVIGLGDAAVVVEPLLAREDPDLDAEGRRIEARRWLAFECLGSGIVEEVGGRRLRFWHLTFEEYLAARQLAWRGDGEDAEADWWPLVNKHLDDAQWRETVEMLPGCLMDEGGVGRVDRLLERVLGLRTERSGLATDARIAGILGRLLRPLGVLEYKPSSEVSAAYDQALERSMAIFDPEVAGQVPVEPRIAAAEALGRGGDPRLAAGADEWRFLKVPGLGGWRLGKYPVTVEEYQRFVEARGYEEAQHWKPEGWELREKEGWDSPDEWAEQLEHPSRPVVNVSWYEADAYCRWLGEQRGLKIRLPKEKEWEMAATAQMGEYPWGEAEPDAERANFAPDGETNVGSPTPVGIYPLGDGPYGHCDLAGNVWEWSADRHEAIEDEDWRVLRGGGWDYSADNLRSAIRVRYPASNRDGVIGFRVLAAPASLDS